MARRIAAAAAAIMIGSTAMAMAQQSSTQVTGQNFPDGLGKDTVVSICSGCHDLARLTAGYTPEGWLSITTMMRNFGAPVPDDQWETVRAYLIRSFPEKPRPEAVLLPGTAQASIMQWPLPTPGSRPHDPMVARDGGIWWSGQLANRLGRLDPQTGQMKEYPVDPLSGPHGLVEDKDGNVWFTGNFRGFIGKLDPRSGQVKEYPLPDPRARDPHTIVIDHNGIVWFTVQVGNFVGRLDPATGDIKLVQPLTANARPYGMAVNSRNQDFSSNSAHPRSQPSTPTCRSRNISCPIRPRARAALRSRPTIRFGTPISRAATSATSIRKAAGLRSLLLRAARNRGLTALPRPRARSGTSNPAPSPTRSCGSIRKLGNSRAGLFRVAATSCAT